MIFSQPVVPCSMTMLRVSGRLSMNACQTGQPQMRERDARSAPAMRRRRRRSRASSTGRAGAGAGPARIAACRPGSRAAGRQRTARFSSSISPPPSSSAVRKPLWPCMMQISVDRRGKHEQPGFGPAGEAADQPGEGKQRRRLPDEQRRQIGQSRQRRGDQQEGRRIMPAVPVRRGAGRGTPAGRRNARPSPTLRRRGRRAPSCPAVQTCEKSVPSGRPRQSSVPLDEPSR